MGGAFILLVWLCGLCLTISGVVEMLENQITNILFLQILIRILGIGSPIASTLLLITGYNERWKNKHILSKIFGIMFLANLAKKHVAIFPTSALILYLSKS